MSNYTKENLIQIPPSAVPAGTLAIKVGNEIFTPGNIRIASGGETFYKCTSVDTINKTWSGYKAVLTDGVYTFEDTVTAGLIYGAGFTPNIGNIYPDGALLTVKSVWTGKYPEDVFIYASLSSPYYEVGDGGVQTIIGDINYGVQHDGSLCAFFDNAVGSIELPAVPEIFTASVNIVPVSGVGAVLFIGTDGFGTMSGIHINADNATMDFQKGSEAYGTFDIGDLIGHRHCYILRRNGNVWTVFVDGVKKIEIQHTPSISSREHYIYLGGIASEYGPEGRYAMTGYFSDFRYYSRALSDDEIIMFSK